jgi:hypothetical protein
MRFPTEVRLRTMMAFVVITSLAIVCATESSAQQSPGSLKTVSVCELFADLASHSGTRVKVRGILYSGREVFALGEKLCSKKFVTRYRSGPELLGLPGVTSEYVWPTAINLRSSSESTEEESVVRVLNMLKQARASQRSGNGNVDLWVTVVGVISTKEHYDVALSANGELVASGYGHLGGYPAQLVIETMTDPEVKLTKE